MKCLILVVSFSMASVGCLASPVLAVPPQALNKTIRLSWLTSGTAVTTTGETRTYNTSQSRTIYISGAGRAFVKMNLRSGRGRAERSEERAPDESQKGTANFVGDKLVGIEKIRSGARQYQVAFVSSFTSCTPTVRDAKESGQTIRRKAPNGAMVEIQSSTSSSPSCSIENGDALGGQ